MPYERLCTERSSRVPYAVTEVGVGEQFHILDQAKVQQLINAFELMEEEEPQSAEPSPGDQAAVEGEGASPDQAAAPMKI